ncbi:hypothetical protein RhiirA4_482997 [Rhizophagus irregularis]|uniref:Uncharacterized protein n=1 Tax=Rhizophagus irregularis TaxID=588596 RepID=A0A2I1HLW5_9GLOM|nr:hypothetical protein RhiirA4_482997 [Rhizophagus irregularis]
MVDDFKKRPDGGFDVWIFRSKANQRVNTNHRGKGEKLILSNNPILINDYDRPKYSVQSGLVSDYKPNQTELNGLGLDWTE